LFKNEICRVFSSSLGSQLKFKNKVYQLFSPEKKLNKENYTFKKQLLLILRPLDVATCVYLSFSI